MRYIFVIVDLKFYFILFSAGVMSYLSLFARVCAAVPVETKMRPYID